MQNKVIRLISLGCTVKEAAKVLGLSPNTVDNHKAKAMSRIGANNSAMLTRYAILHGISAVDDSLTPDERQLLGTPMLMPGMPHYSLNNVSQLSS